MAVLAHAAADRLLLLLLVLRRQLLLLLLRRLRPLPQALRGRLSRRLLWLPLLFLLLPLLHLCI